uniref:Aminoglycoside phosphotransferase domain-containing protein n=2 Tax=Spongospora subterranea TaxID=70186 RepID=A0A0H5QJ03_9EUKA|eukprot:CRZ01632.1 hypothetical protein [Spongospora subterranea]
MNIAARSPQISAFGSYENILFNVNENFQQTASHVGQGFVSASVFAQVKSQTLKVLSDVHDLIQERAINDEICDSHGDLRLEHVYRCGSTINIIDCIEFNDRFRYGDPLLDVAFLYMDLFYESAGFSLPERLFAEYVKACRIQDVQRLKPLVALYSSYRSIVRAKVTALRALDVDVDGDERDQSRKRAQRHWNVALMLITSPSSRPGVILVSGLPGSGKSTVALALESLTSHSVIIRSDVIRKESPGTVISYDDEAKAVLYGEMLVRASKLVSQGKLVLVDATFNLPAEVEHFRGLALDQGVVFAILLCCCKDQNVNRERIEKREGDASDANWEVYKRMARSWVGPTLTTANVSEVDTSGTLEQTKKNAQSALASIGLL